MSIARAIGRKFHAARRRLNGRRWRFVAKLATAPQTTTLVATPAPPSAGDSDASSPARFSIVIPMVHPNHANVNDYSALDARLELTVASIDHQSHSTVRTVVLGHRAPEWDLGRYGNLLYIDLGASRTLAGQLSTPHDKGVKMLLGALLDRRLADCDVVVTADADDFLHEEVAANTARYLRDHPSSNGIKWTRGYDLLVSGDEPRSTTLIDAYEVGAFDRICGTSRAIRMNALIDSMPTAAGVLDPVAKAMTTHLTAHPYGLYVPPSDLLTQLDVAVSSLSEVALSEIEHLGKHVTPHFNLDPHPMIGAGKTCGHGQHDGYRGGSIHWQAVRRRVAPADAIRHLGVT